jgi:hypothetical protein
VGRAKRAGAKAPPARRTHLLDQRPMTLTDRPCSEGSDAATGAELVLVIPAKAGIQLLSFPPRAACRRWIPAFAGMTDLGGLRTVCS